MKKNLLKAVLLVSMLLFNYLPGFSAYLRNVPIKIVQPDGTVLHVYATGDEYYFRIHDGNNYTIVRNPATAYYVYAIKSGGELLPSDVIVGQGDPTQDNLEPGASISAEKWKQLRAEFWANTPARPVLTDNASLVPTTSGAFNNLVVFIRFSDQIEFPADMNLYRGMFNDSSAGANSMYNYFKEASYNSLHLSSYFYPLATGQTILSYQDSHPRAYYIPYDAVTNPSGYQPDERQGREHELLQNAVNAIEASVPAGLNIDHNNDGYVDNVCFIIRGNTTEWSTLLWPHRWVLSSFNVMINGKQVWDYNFQLEEFLPTQGNGVLCHEMFHSLGAPDLYHYSQDAIQPAGPWDLMEISGNPPVSMSAFMKYKYGGWIADVPVINTNGTYSLNPVTSATNNIYKINSPNSGTEYFILEYRKQSGTFESTLPGEGLLIWRINPDAGDGNANGPPDEVYVYRPDGDLYNNGNVDEANFSAGEGRTEFSDITNPSSFLSDGSPGGMNISGITAAGATISFTCQAGGGGGTSLDSISESFEGVFPPENWTKYNGDLGSGWEQQTVGTSPVPGWDGGVITAVPNGAGGSKMAFCTYTTGGMFWNDQWLISPRVNITTGYKLSFWVRKFPNAFLDTLTIHISTTDENPFSFEPFTQIGWAASDSGWSYHEYALDAFAGQQIYVAFQEHVWDNYTDGAALFLDLVKVKPPTQAGTDVGVTQLVSPVSGYNLTGNEPVTVTIKNFGTSPQSNICVSYKVNNGSIVSSTCPATIAPGASINFTFSQTLNLAVSGIYTITAFTCLAGDIAHNNDTVNVPVHCLQEPGLLYDNGPLYNSVGTGAGGNNESILQSNTLGMSNFGYNGSLANGYRLAEDFTVPVDTSWSITGFSFYSYQFDAPLSTTVNKVNIRIWSGVPGNSVVIYGDTVANNLTSSVFSGTYRVMEGNSGNTQRPLMQNLCLFSSPVTLSTGTFYIDWQYGGTLSTGPYSPPIVVSGQSYTGNARQYDPTLGAWKNAVDQGSSTQQGLPFRVYGDAVADSISTGVITSLPQDTACSGSVMVPIRVTNLNGVGAISLVLNHTSGLTYVGYQNVHPSLASGTLIVNPVAGKVNIGWFSLTPANIGSDILLSLEFSASGSASHLLTWSTIPGACQYQDINNQVINSSFVNGYVFTKPCANLTGQITYDNDLNSIMTTTQAVLKQGNTVLHQSTSDANGDYEILNIDPGIYTLDGQCNKPAGSINAQDALLILRHFVGQITLVNLRLKAGDVDGSGFINAADALMTARRFVGAITTFPAGDWTFEQKSVTIPASGTVIENFKALCVGDVNGSNTPPLKESLDVNLDKDLTVINCSHKPVEIPLKVMQPLSVGAISLVLAFDPGLFDILGVSPLKEGMLIYKTDGNYLKIAWYSLIPLDLSPGDPCFTITVLPKKAQKEIVPFHAEPGSVFGDTEALTIHGVQLSQPLLAFDAGQANLYPNPCRDVINIEIRPEKEGVLAINLFDVTGNKLISKTLMVSAFTEINQPLQVMDLSPGVYVCKIDLDGNPLTYKRIIKE